MKLLIETFNMCTLHSQQYIEFLNNTHPIGLLLHAYILYLGPDKCINTKTIFVTCGTQVFKPSNNLLKIWHKRILHPPATCPLVLKLDVSLPC